MVSNANGHYLNVFILLEKFFDLHSSTEITSDDLYTLYTDIEKLLVSDSSIIMGRKLLPGFYSLSKNDVPIERNEPGSAKRNPSGQIPHLWGQALFILCKLLIEGCLTPSELDPLNRRLTTEKKAQVQVQVAVIAQSNLVKEKLSELGFDIQTEEEILKSNLKFKSCSSLAELSTQLGKSEKLGLSGRPKKACWDPQY